MDMKGSVFIVTGGASGLGEATVRMLVQYGALVVIVDQNELRGRAVQEDIGARTSFEKADITSEYQMRNAIDRGLNRFGEIHGVVNTAGICHIENLCKEKGVHSLDIFNEIIQVNLAGSFNVARLVAETMRNNTVNDDGERGVIIQTSAAAAYDGMIGQAAYSAAMGGVASMTLPLARELGSYGIRAITIAPGAFYTPMYENLPQAVQEKIEAEMIFPYRIGSPDEYALLVKSIISNPMINGEIIRLDGGKK
ncbi:NAD(P)-dependent dehydrogenase (short-subunit alcohol dehydrogenase family) [Salisediminibacterium halotolerans]|nr:SDR family NAD(P)-dependent oxidoreductase [Salisediminibacterium halotolerans]RLJ69671.1 NAD(P)-dependent dehydrogenase (short-subunit alcohol dehydrogenase family) [Actinophytocola xinjiangensis]RPE89729.1 NAD(P)-dependent dehydrogenase (short-subunit alcohol dehydrogenase family) [Salisediminibacterium halotolerans]TWG32565.1 NAD(P)-dependent dehydrogenase (short-subunit alcohol dehydrogenase family) [Salisediminibacterium halotolerans]GEL09193.1 3-hydroxyacyl-CoA dehydrogenase [Salisedim